MVLLVAHAEDLVPSAVLPFAPTFSEYLVPQHNWDGNAIESLSPTTSDSEGSPPNEHTVLLVAHSEDLVPSAVLPFAPTFNDYPVPQHNLDGNAIESLSPTTALTSPCPQAVSRSSSDLSRSADTTAIQTQRLPTPYFTGLSSHVRRVPGSFRSFLPRGLILMSFHIPTTSFLFSPPASSRPQAVRVESDQSLRSTLSTASTVSVDSGHDCLIPSIGTTAKFTHKWPPPEPMRKVDLYSGGLNEAMGPELSQAVVAAMEEGQGLEMGDEQTRTLSKWCLLLSVSSVFSYGAVGLVCAIMTWFGTLVGICGAFLNSRPILAAYTLLLWPTLVSLLAVGYVSYKRVTFSLDRKLNLSWSQYYTPLGRLLIQDSLHCCGYYSALHGATPSSECYPRSPLPGCKGKLYRFEQNSLATIWSAAFALALLHILNIFVALLCANHLTKTFGRGITPKQYRLSGKDVKADADNILKELGRPDV
ncbi:hypothetical protein FPV67DRAFT_1478090 [Lyophyllum atratum]|nr:hypothetical protein FPV67DRAFT_1478090 [Lyophyllum atratum]